MIEFNKDGTPSIMISQKAVMLDNDGIKDLNLKDSEIETSEIKGKTFIPWGDDNDFPVVAEQHIKNIPALRKAINDLCKISLGQGIYPGIVKGIDANGVEEIEVINEPEIVSLVNNFWARSYLSKCVYSLRSKGNAFVQLVPNKTGDKILKLNPIKAKFARLNEKGDRLFVSASWETTDEESFKEFQLLDEIDPEQHLKVLKEGNNLNKSVVMHLKNPFSDNDFYAAPDWLSSGVFLEVAEKIANSINAGIDNLLNIQYIINIPRTYWLEKYPKEEFKSENERREKIAEDIENLEERFTSVENTRKTLTYHFDPNLDDKIEVDVVENKFSKENLMNSTAADTQIALAAGISPDLLGLMYGNSKGGSMQRELLLLQYALSHNERQLLADPLEMLIRFNYGEQYNNVQIKFRNTFLTTLDSGSGTNQVLS